MSEFKSELHLRWSDLDPNQHLRHSVYYDFAAQQRTEMFSHFQIDLAELTQRDFGPVLFEEGARFRRELRFGQRYHMTGVVQSLRRDYSRFHFMHQIWQADKLCAEVEVRGAWMSLSQRKLIVPPEDFCAKLAAFPRAADFQWQEG